jgi:hypothetical protein
VRKEVPKHKTGDLLREEEVRPFLHLFVSPKMLYPVQLWMEFRQEGTQMGLRFDGVLDVTILCPKVRLEEQKPGRTAMRPGASALGLFSFAGTLVKQSFCGPVLPFPQDLCKSFWLLTQLFRYFRVVGKRHGLIVMDAVKENQPGSTSNVFPAGPKFILLARSLLGSTYAECMVALSNMNNVCYAPSDLLLEETATY